MTDAPFPARAQFVIGENIEPNAGFERLPFDPVTVFSGPELAYELGPSVAVLGHAASVTGSSVKEAIEQLGERPSLDAVFELRRHLAGRFVIVADTASGPVVCPDALASKDTFMTPGGSALASNERLLCDLTEVRIGPVSEDAAHLVNSRLFRARESSWFGATSPMSPMRHIPPNHFATIGDPELKPIPLAIASSPVAVDDIAQTMSQMVKALAELRPLRLGLTAGFDSRIILAACLHAEVNIECFTFTDGAQRKTQDSDEAARICDALGVDFRVIPEPEPEDDTVADLLARSQAVVRSDRHVLAQLEWYRTNPPGEPTLILSGMGGEISRAKFGLGPRTMGQRLTRAAALGRTSVLHDLDAFDRWWDDRASRHELTHARMPTTTQFHWEQRVGVWGSQFLGEKDLFVDELPGFASLLLQEQLLSHPQRRRSSLLSTLFVELIERLAPQLAALGRPVPSPAPYRAYYATPFPHIVRSLAPQARALKGR